MPLSDDFLLTQVTIDLVDGPRSRARLYADPDDVRGRGLDATFLNVQQVVDMTDATVMLWWSHDQAPALRGLEPFEAIDASVGRWKVHWPSAMGQSAGTVTAKVMVTEGDREIAIPLPAIEVLADRADPSATPSEDTFSVLAELLLQYQEGVPAIEVAVEGANEAAQGARDAAREATDAAGLASAAAQSADAAAGRADAAAEDARETARAAAEDARETARAAAEDASAVAEDLERRRDAGEFKGDKGETGDTGPAGPEGPRGEKGEKGDTGEGLEVHGTCASEEELRELHPEGDRAGDAYMVGTHYFVWDGSDWVDAGDLKGPKGDPGENATTTELASVEAPGLLRALSGREDQVLLGTGEWGEHSGGGGGSAGPLWLEVDEAGDLYAYYDDGSSEPLLDYDEGIGDLYAIFETEA